MNTSFAFLIAALLSLNTVNAASFTLADFVGRYEVSERDNDNNLFLKIFDDGRISIIDHSGNMKCAGNAQISSTYLIMNTFCEFSGASQFSEMDIFMRVDISNVDDLEFFTARFDRFPIIDGKEHSLTGNADFKKMKMRRRRLR